MSRILTVTTEANSRMLASRASLQAEDSSISDANADRYLVAASALIRQVLGREPWLQVYSERIPGPGGNMLRLSRWPIKGDPSSVTYGTGSSPDTVDATTYSVAGGARRDRLWRNAKWALSEQIERTPTYGSVAPDYTVTYTAGWIMPGELTEWAASTAFAANAWCKSTVADEPMVFQATVGGDTGGSEPTWPTAEEGTVTDNEITWTAYRLRLPEDLEEAALMLALDWSGGGLSQPVGIAEERVGSWSARYLSDQRALSSALSAIVGAYR